MIDLVLNTALCPYFVGFKRANQWQYTSWTNTRETVSVIYDFFAEHDIADADFQQVLALRGPGSFTNLRAGSAIVQTLLFERPDTVLKAVSGLEYVQQYDSYFCFQASYLIPAYGNKYFVVDGKTSALIDSLERVPSGEERNDFNRHEDPVLPKGITDFWDYLLPLATTTDVFQPEYVFPPVS